ncbi:MAG TPA: PEGA domain-containing protein [Methanoregulaceae archaeon]|nr:PEGA domain-containing protein [Methanoregulaceae archaeon]
MNPEPAKEYESSLRENLPVTRARSLFSRQMGIQRLTTLTILLLAAASFCIPAQAAQAKETYLGDMVTLSGYSYGSDTVYLFLTGPNLPVNGVALDNINRPTEQGGFTAVDVNSDGSWSYKWYTGQTGGKLDAGTYAVWVVDRPVGRSNLGTTDYSTIAVNLQQPGISVGSPTVPGGLTVNSTPAGANLFLNGKYEGTTPVTVPNLDPGTYVATLSRSGFLNQSNQVEIQAGALTTLSVPLLSANGTLWVTTVPIGGSISIDGTDAGIAPVLLTNLIPGNHTLIASLPGVSPVQETVRVIGGATIPVSITVTKENLTFEHQASPTNPVLFAGVLPSGIFACVIVVFLLGCRKWQT